MLDRRRLLLALASSALAACHKTGGDARREPPPIPGEGWKDIPFEPTPDAPEGQRALIYSPPGSKDLPLLIALHGRGESGRGLDIGAHAWRDDYYIDHLIDRLASPPLSPRDLRDIASQERLTLLNRSLADNPFRGINLACPYSPDLPDKSPEGAAAYARFLINTLLPRARAETRADPSRAATGIDGVSMGGRLALLIGLTHPDIFGAVGALQPAIRESDAPMLSALAQRALPPFSLRLVSSDSDPFLPAVRAASDRMRAGSIPHELLIVPGPHNYEWNRGPGGVEMLLWHERIQRGLRAP